MVEPMQNEASGDVSVQPVHHFPLAVLCRIDGKKLLRIFASIFEGWC